MPDGLFPPGVCGNALDRQVNFNEAFGVVGHELTEALIKFTSVCLSPSGTDFKYSFAEI